MTDNTKGIILYKEMSGVIGNKSGKQLHIVENSIGLLSVACMDWFFKGYNHYAGFQGFNSSHPSTLEQLQWCRNI